MAARRAILLTLGLAALVAGLAGALGISALVDDAVDVPRRPMTASEQAAPDEGEPGVEEIDWAAWREINPDVIGWVSIPGTGIDHPVAQAPSWDEEHYLRHDAYGKRNPCGCPYLDAGCAEEGLLGCRNAVILGHNINGGLLFSDLSRFSDEEYARAHDEVLIQTPDESRTYRVVAVDVIRGTSAVKRTSFDGYADFEGWWATRYESSRLRLAEELPEVGQVAMLVTCSYNFWRENERTVVYAVPEGAGMAAYNGGEADER